MTAIKAHLEFAPAPREIPIGLDRDGISFSMPRSAAASLDGFREWYTSEETPDRCKISFLGDEVYFEMSPERINSYVSLKAEIISVLLQHAKSTGHGFAFADGVLVTNKSAQLSNEPDGMFIRRETVRSGAVTLLRTKDGQDLIEVVGSPDLVVEFVSPSSVHKDRKRLRDRYAIAGVQEYWLIDTRDGDVNLQMLAASSRGFVEVPDQEGWFRSEVLGLDVRLNRHDDHEFSVWWYVMELGLPAPH